MSSVRAIARARQVGRGRVVWPALFHTCRAWIVVGLWAWSVGVSAQPVAAEAEAEAEADAEAEAEADAESEAEAEAEADAEAEAVTDVDGHPEIDAAIDAAGDDFDFFAAADAAIADEEDESFWDRITYTVTSTTVAQYRLDNFNSFSHDDNYLTLWERLEGAVQADGLRLSVRLDGVAAVFEDPCPEGFPDDDCVGNDLRVERFTAHWEHQGLKLDAVDSYAVLGRGIALSMRRVDILGVDTALRGGQAAYQHEGFYMKLLGGNANPQNLDPQTLTLRRQPVDRPRGGLFTSPEVRDWIVGGEAGVRLGPHQELEVGFHALKVWFADTGAGAVPQSVDVQVGGFHLSAPALIDGKLILYGEVNIAERYVDRLSDFAEDDLRSGYAIYGSAQLRLGSLAVLLEWKDYSDYMVAQSPTTGEVHRIYSAAPTLELDMERPRALHNARGGRLQVDYGFAPSAWSASFNALVYAHAEEEAGELPDPFDGILVTHGYARIQKINDTVGAGKIGWTFDLVLGARRETALHEGVLSPGQGELDWRVYHGQIDAGIVIGQHSLELTIIHRSEHMYSGGRYVDFVRGTSSLTWSYAGRFRLSPTLNWNTENSTNPSLYPGAEARVDFLEGSFVRVFGGRTPGGRVCSGGVCRDVPPFEGLLAEVVLRL